MIELNDPYWRRLLSIAVGGTLALAALALTFLPVQEHGVGEGSGGVNDAALNVTAVHTAQGSVAADQWWVSVDVTDAGKLSARNLSATVKGVTLAEEPSSEGQVSGQVGRGASATHTITVERPLHISVAAQGTGFNPTGGLSLTLASPSGKTWNGSGSGTNAVVSIDAADLEERPDGDYEATVSHTAGFRGISYRLSWNVTHMPPHEVQVWPSLEPGEAHSFVWMAKSPSPPSEPQATVTIDATMVDAAGSSFQVHYQAGQNQSGPVGGGEGSAAFLTSGEFLGFAALGVMGLSVASGTARTRGGRAASQERARREVTLHRIAWVAVLALLLVHGTVQIAAGHLDDTAAVLVGLAAFGAFGSLVWFNAYNRKRVLAMPWSSWLRLKLLWVALALALVAVHVFVFGRHFAG